MASTSGHVNGQTRRLIPQVGPDDAPTDRPAFGHFEEEAIIALALDKPEWAEPAVRHLKPDMFGRTEAKYVWAWVMNLFEKHGVIPTREILRDAVARQLTIDEPYQDILHVIERRSDPREVPIIRERLEAWLKDRVAKRLYDGEVITDVERGNYDVLTEIMDDLHAIGTSTDDPFAGLITAEDLLDLEFEEEWLIKDILTPQDFCVIGGPMKSMKTAVAIDLAVSLATAAKFLGEYEVVAPQKVIVATGETSPREMQARISRVLRARDKEPGDAQGRLVWLPRTPKMNAKGHLALLRRFLERQRPAVLIIDPLYVSMLAGDNSTQSSDLMRTGPILENLNRACKEFGVTTIVCHHFNRKGDPGGIPTLLNLTQTGPAEYARQWLLLNRCGEYQHNGVHNLWLVAGGSDGRSLVKRLTIEEGNKDKPRWGIVLEDAREHRAREGEQKNGQMVDKLVNAIDGLTELEGRGVQLTKNKLRKATGYNLDHITKAINLATEAGDVESYEATVAGNCTTCYRRRHPATGIGG